MCLRKVSHLLHEKYKGVEDGSEPSIYMHVIFFPDQGIIGDISSDINFGSVNNSPYPHYLTSDLKSGQAKNVRRIHNHTTNTNPSSPQTGFSQSDNRLPVYLHVQTDLQNSNLPHTHPHHNSVGIKNSTSLVRLVKVLDSARESIVVCLYCLSCKDLIDALVRAKKRGVHVRVLLDRNMCTEVCQRTMDILRENNIPARPNHRSLMMHHKFAIVDAPTENDYQPQEAGTMDHKGNTISHQPANVWNLGFGNVFKFLTELRHIKSRETVKKRNSGIMMTGSFNWTWSAVIKNHENVIITNHPMLVQQFIQEFEALWSCPAGV
ncbi:hypothetical protein Pcinc_024051 [Petrolisthes cinctipes]|uniref:Mitochondrial cardiolipin hydrolase n=1 Tax=Petrolisthes cinctipes TaxID=88211 RepID=A0AAE1KFW4_PETCI|nr:hypothetical protein Pcinc_024051 [Petrolisthes cinctipes]